MSDRIYDDKFVMQFEVARAHQQFLGLPGQWDSKGANFLGLITKVTLSLQVRDFFRSLLNTGGAYRSGPLFGQRVGDETLHFDYAALAGYQQIQDQTQPYTMDPSYLLGWTDALRAVSTPPLEWLGQWLCFPDRYHHQDAAAQQVKRQAQTQYLLDHRTALLCVGYVVGGLGLDVQGWTTVGDAGMLPLGVSWDEES